MTSKTIERIIPFDLIVQAEEGEDYQEYVFKGTNQKVPSGTNIGFEREYNGVLELILCDDIDFLSF